VLGFHNPNPASVARIVWLDPRSRGAAGSVDLHSQERQTPLPNLVFSQPTLLHRSERGQCTPCTGHPHGYNNTASALEDRNNSSPSTNTSFQCFHPLCIST